MTESGTTHRPPRIAALGIASWDTLLRTDRQPTPVSAATVREQYGAPGGTTGNTATALARLGAAVTCMVAVGDDPLGDQVLQALAAEGIDVSWSVRRPGEPTDQATVIVSDDPPDRSVIWLPGAQVRKGDRFDIGALFAHDVVILDVADMPLFRFLTDLPAHIDPRTRILGPLNYLADPNVPDRLELALRCDTVVGSEADLCVLTDTSDAEAAIALFQGRMRGSNARLLAVTRGAQGSRLILEDAVIEIPAIEVEAVDPTGAGDAYLAGIAWGMARRMQPIACGRIAACVGGLATRSLGGQAALPTAAEVAARVPEFA